jgi:hypothetical protein
MAEYQITCITKPNRMSLHEHITHVGNSSWTPKTITRETVIQLINEGHNFFVIDPNIGKKVYVRVVTPGLGRAQYIQTYADGIPTDNLLSLPEC